MSAHEDGLALPEGYGLPLAEFEAIEPLVTHILVRANDPSNGLISVEWVDAEGKVLDRMTGLGAGTAALVSDITGWRPEHILDDDGVPVLRFTRPPREADIAA